MADPEDNGHLPAPAEKPPEHVDPTDSLYLRVQEISNSFLSFYEMLSSNDPVKLAEIEAYFEKYPKAEDSD